MTIALFRRKSATPRPLKESLVSFATYAELESALPTIRQAPADVGTVRLIVRRPAVGVRETLEHGELTPAEGLGGDGWRARLRPGTPVAAADANVQLTLMNSRAVAAIAGPQEKWPLAGDQLFVDLDLSLHNLPPGTRLAIGSAIVVVSAEPHTGCGKFRGRFGADALRFVNSPVGRELNLRGINARVERAGRVAVGDAIRKLGAESAVTDW